MRKKVFLIAGGSGGHIFPAIALTEINKNFNYLFLLDERTEKLIRRKRFDYVKIISSKINLNLLLPIYIIKIFIGFIQSIFILKKHKPDIVIGFGGYTSIPSIFAAKALKIKILIHEQNSIMGRTNRILSYLTKNIATTFKKTKFADKKAIYTGIPVRQKRSFKISTSKNFRILVVGGSQGAQIFSKIIPKIAGQLNNKAKKKIIVVQQVRKEDKLYLEKKYKKIKIILRLEEFFNDIYSEYNQCDLIICRCGSSTLAEIKLFKKFAVLFPLPSAMNNHQYFNALEFRKNNNCMIVNEKKVRFSRISKEIEKRIFLKKKSCKLKKQNKVKEEFLFSNLVKRILEENV
ncbi:MAG: UDP-N-acetylglucosamine--N-acetylmuramyl-(pentapeptide) pyrophosphoryl-undecaprenol N-acetylglucosamine transferase [Pseudomonadota bacterium]|nr:UDP-N-acetylglucosamine--N-acetylmuramyl-(pentapeptide) pyrophosphoryl-undecaprenol N-acetylglucosamine transferase [Pseudomonadota bacterium]